MNISAQRGFIVGLAVVALAALTGCDLGGKSENELIGQLASPNQDVVRGAMGTLEARYPSSTTWQPAVRERLADSREEVCLKAARVLGVVHAEVSEEDLKNITRLFKAARPNVVMGALKALRGLKAESTLPQILPLLRNADDGIVRDALRTLAGLGNASHLPQVEPLLNHPNAKVQKDASSCVAALKAKN